ncbi:hypothetical protein [Shimia sp.]|uniref:hypothetical protein n=1 Tax=Shimia sp. TaxID=1954381 RepID=UPI003B8E2E7B
MTLELVIDIGQVRIDAVGGSEDARRFEETLRRGLEKLAEKLASSPFARNPEATALVIETMQIDDLNRDDWVGDRGAVRIAECLFDAISTGGAQR